LFEERIVPLASPDFIRKHWLKRPEHLLDVPLTQSNVGVVQWADWFAGFTDRRSPERFTLRFDRAQMALDAATQGLGVALESTTIVGGHIAERKLRPVLGLEMAIQVKGHFAVYPARHAKRAPVEAFLGWLHREASRRSTSRS
jgi:DNA-binding transcriptional LysR family regulator